MATKQTIRFLRSEGTLLTRDAAVNKLKTLTHKKGQPVVVFYTDNALNQGSPYALLAIGTGDGSGAEGNNFKIIASYSDITALEEKVKQDLAKYVTSETFAGHTTKVASPTALGHIKAQVGTTGNDAKDYKVKVTSEGVAYVTVPWTDTTAEIPVKGVSSTDKVLALDGSKNLTSTLGISYDSSAKKIKLTGKSGAEIASIDASAFIKDGMLESARYDSAKKQIILTFNTDAGKEPIAIDVASLVNIYTDGQGIKVNPDNTLSLNLKFEGLTVQWFKSYVDKSVGLNEENVRLTINEEINKAVIDGGTF